MRMITVIIGDMDAKNIIHTTMSKKYNVHIKRRIVTQSIYYTLRCHWCPFYLFMKHQFLKEMVAYNDKERKGKL